MRQNARHDFSQDEIPWWLHPVPVFVGLNGLTGVAAFLAQPGTYLELWGTPRYFNGFTLLLTAAVIVVFSAGVWLALSKQSAHSSRSEWRGTVSFSQTLLLFNVSFWISVMAYAIWIGLGLARGLGLELLKSIFIGGDVAIYILREPLETVPGITTWTQVGIAAVVLGCMIGIGGGWKIVRRKLAILAVLALVRGLLYSERLAFLELAIPFLVLWLAQPASWKPSRVLRTLIRIAPVLGAAIIYMVFTCFESFRSWSIYYSSRESSLLLFGFWRLVGYYVTSVNNTAYLLSSFHHPLGAPYFSFTFLWEFPVLNVFVKDLFSWVHMDYKSYMDLLAFGANPEFNNPGGLLSPVVDFGVLGGLAYWAAMGLITGHLYYLFISKHPLGMCLYPVVYLTLTEIPRYLYWGEGRAFPALVYLILSATVLLRSARFSHDSRDEDFTPIEHSIEMPARV
ncbi:MAG TPA: O-antigen polymerase [Verrucomicrobiae bacterium]|nr:O-antigen polymerase [Verrucomicrobiae bacterium]